MTQQSPNSLRKIMLWLAGLSASFLLLTGIVAIWGLLLEPSYQNTYTVTLPVSSDTLWQQLVTPKPRAIWDGQIQSTEQLARTDKDDDEQLRWKDIYPNQTEINYSIKADAKAQTLLRKVDDPSLPIHFSWSILLESSKSGTVVAIEEQGQVNNPIVRYLVYKWVGNDIFAKRFTEQLERFAEQNPLK